MAAVRNRMPASGGLAHRERLGGQAAQCAVGGEHLTAIERANREGRGEGGTVVDEVWRVVAIGDDGLGVPGPTQSERVARELFAQLRGTGSHRMELQRLEGAEWVTVETSWLRIAPGTGKTTGEAPHA